MKVDIIEAGFPIASPGDFDAVKAIAEELDGPVVAGLARSLEKDIKAAGNAVKNARRPRIHVFLATSAIHREHKLKKAKDEIVRQAVHAVQMAREFCQDIEFSPEDASRTEPEFLCEVIEEVIKAGATTVNIPDTVGYAVPEQYGALIRNIRQNVPGIERAVISVHCHDDLGMAVANTLHGVLNGARQVEGTINGLGERAGNAALEEIVMALRTRADYFGVHTGVETRELHRTSRLVADMLGTQVPPNKAVIGANAFAHSSGIHVDGFLKQRETYEIMRPEDVGMSESRVVLTARTGRHGLLDRLKKLGYPLSDQELDQAYRRFLIVADKKQEVFDEDLMAILHDEIHALPATYELQYLHIYSGTSAIPTATVRLRVGDATKEGAAIGDGPVDAVCRAIAQVTNTSASLKRYEIRGVTSGTEAMGEVTVQLEDGGRKVVGRGASTDVIEASAKAYIDGLNKLATAHPAAATAS